MRSGRLNMSNSRIHSAGIDMSESRKISMRMICYPIRIPQRRARRIAAIYAGLASFKDMIIRVARADGNGATRSSYRCHLTPLVKEQDYLVSRRDGDPCGSSISIDEVLLMPLVLTPLPNARRQYLDRLAHKRGVKLKVVTEAASSSAQLNLVLRGLGSAVLPFSAAQVMLRDRRVKIVPIKGLQSHRVMLTSVKGTNPVGADKVSREIRGVFSARIWDNLLSKPI
jgi:DNA-binding transcriptional LysR family regulator